MIKKILIGIACFLGAVILFVAISILPINRYNYKTQSFYSTMMKRMDSVMRKPLSGAPHTFSVGYAKVNLTPRQRVATAGYGNRRGKLYTSLHDSIYVRAMVISNGNTKVAIVSADLLIIPPTVTYLLEKELPGIGFSINNTYLGATHSHNSIGNWGEGAATFLYGDYSDSIVHFIVDRIKTSILKASENGLPAKLKTAHIPISHAVRNRIYEGGGLDSLLHVLEITRSDSSKLVMMSYTAHATCLPSNDIELSRDYPGKLVDDLEKKGYSFAMFMAGAVGSHGNNAPEGGWNCVDWMAETIEHKFESRRDSLHVLQDSVLTMYRIPLALGNAQVKISEDWRVRPWLFNAALGESPNYLTALRIGDLVMLGTPCDFSGELTLPLYLQASKENLQAMVTSFNGGYIGYITPIQYYDSTHYETRLMNWYGPGNGEYMDECMEDLIKAVAAKKTYASGN